MVKRPRQWQDKTHERSATTAFITGRQNFNVAEVKVDTQLHKVLRHKKDLTKRLAKYQNELRKHSTPEERKAELRALIIKAETHYHKATISEIALNKRANENAQRWETMKRKEAEKEKERAIQAEHIRMQVKHNPKLAKMQASVVFPSRKEQKIDNTGGRRRIVQKGNRKRWAAE